MSKVTKNEKILRKATSKWEKFLAEGAFNKAPVNEMTMGKEPLPIVQPDQAYLDALRSGQLEERDAGMEVWMEKFKLHARLPQNQPMDEFMKDNAMYAYRQGMDPKQAAEEIRSASLEENEKKSFEVGEFVYIIDGGLRGATGKIAEPTTLVTGEQGYVIHLYSDADKKVFGKQGDEVIAGASKIRSGATFDGSEIYDIDERSEDDERDLEPPVKYGSGAELEWDKKLQKFYDRKRDIYLDDEEAAALIKETVKKTLSSKKKVKSKSVNESAWGAGRAVEDIAGALDMINNVRTKIDNALDYDYELKHTNLDWEMIVKALGEASSKIRQMTQANEETMADMKYADRMAAHSSYSSDPEFDQVHDIAMDSMESGSTGRVLKLDLGDISRRLSAQSFDIERANGGLVIDDKYQIGLMRDLPEDSRRQIGKTPFGLSYVQDAPSDALPKQAGMGREINEAGKMAAYRITFNDKVSLSTIQELTLELLGVGEQFVDKSKEGYAEISATPKGIKRVVDAFRKNKLPTDVITNAKGEQILELFGMFGGKKKKIEAVKKAMVDGGIPEDKVEKLLSDMAEFLADHDIEPAKIEAAVAELMKNPKDHMGGVPGKALLKALGWNAHKRKFVA